MYMYMPKHARTVCYATGVRRYDDIASMEHEFRDVFSCYLREQCPVPSGSTFRLPLRSPEMARKSKISAVSVDVTGVGHLLSALKAELFDILLFTKSVHKVKCSLEQVFVERLQQIITHECGSACTVRCHDCTTVYLCCVFADLGIGSGRHVRPLDEHLQGLEAGPPAVHGRSKWLQASHRGCAARVRATGSQAAGHRLL